MTITLTYTLDASKHWQVQQPLYSKLFTRKAKRSEDITILTDEGQTVYIPEIHTTAADQKN